MKRPNISEQGKSRPWWVLLHEYEVYLSEIEKVIEIFGNKQFKEMLSRVLDTEKKK